MLQKWGYKLYITLLVLLLVVTAVSLYPKLPATQLAPIATPVESLGFYSNSIPTESRHYISGWLAKNNVDQSANNIVPRAGSLRDTSYRLGAPLQRNVSLIIDIKKPATSFTVLVDIDPAGNVSPLTSVRCNTSDTPAKLAKCQEMLRT